MWNGQREREREREWEGREKGGEQGDGMGLSLVNRGKPAEGWVASDRTRERERKTQKGEREDVHTLPLVVAGLQYQLLRDAQGFLRFCQPTEASYRPTNHSLLMGGLEGSEAGEGKRGEERRGEERRREERGGEGRRGERRRGDTKHRGSLRSLRVEQSCTPKEECVDGGMVREE